MSERDIVELAVSFSRTNTVLSCSARVAIFVYLIFTGVVLSILASRFFHCVHILFATHSFKSVVEVRNTTNTYAFYLE